MSDAASNLTGQHDNQAADCAGVMLVFCNFPDPGTASEIAGELIEKGFAACVNLLPGIESIYRWEGELRKEAEVLAIFKVSAGKFPELERELLEKHPYEIPEIIGIMTDRAWEGYAKWVTEF
ncbi:MAG: divalent-cation tolerance protein CutA [Armatimonadetes bacterium]|nr:divalent-cation tolerance protein CutA [Akkermansiaceae bacterium]